MKDIRWFLLTSIFINTIFRFRFFQEHVSPIGDSISRRFRLSQSTSTSATDWGQDSRRVLTKVSSKIRKQGIFSKVSKFRATARNSCASGGDGDRRSECRKIGAAVGVGATAGVAGSR